MQSDLLHESGWLETITGVVREGSREIGSCTSSCPASTIDYHVIHETLGAMVTPAQVDLVTKLSPHRPVWSVLQVQGGQPVPVQKVLQLPSTKVYGPLQPHPSYANAKARLDVLNKPGKLEDLQADLQQEINECYAEWRTAAVDELLLAQDIDPATVPAAKKGTAGAEVKITWEDPRKLARRGRTGHKTWTVACEWVENFFGHVVKLMQKIDETYPKLRWADQEATENGVGKQKN